MTSYHTTRPLYNEYAVSTYNVSVETEDFQSMTVPPCEIQVLASIKLMLKVKTPPSIPMLAMPEIIRKKKTMTEPCSRSARSMTPVTMIDPGALLTLLAAVLCPATPATFGKLSSEFLPFPTFIIGALANATPSIILSTKIAHDNAGPVLHVFGMVTHCELFNKGENIEIIRLKVFLKFITFQDWCLWFDSIFESGQVPVNL